MTRGIITIAVGGTMRVFGPLWMRYSDGMS